MQSKSAVWFVALIAVMFSAANIAAGYRCRGNDVEEAAKVGNCVSHPLAGQCAEDETRCQPEAALFALCDVGQTSIWHQAAMVVYNCNSIARFSPIATFTGGRFSGQAAIFNRCVGSGSTLQIEMFEQSCGGTFSLRAKDGKDYFVIV